jgi:hypothetical protein
MSNQFSTYPASESLSGTSLFSFVPTARIHTWGGLMMAAKFFTPNIPKLEMVNVPPYKTNNGISIVISIVISISIKHIPAQGPSTYHGEGVCVPK